MKLYNTFKKTSLPRIFKGIGDEMIVATVAVIIITIILSLVFYCLEKGEQPDVFGNWWDAVLWGFSRYFESGGDIYNGAPSTGLGIAITILLGLVGLALVGVPTGLFATGFTEAMQEQKKDEKVEKYYRIMKRQYHVISNRLLNDYIGKLRKANPESLAWCEGCNFRHIADNVPISKFVLHRMSIDDILDTCERHPEFRVKNEAAIDSIEDGRSDRFMLEQFPVNRIYGYFKNRGSKVTIVSTSSHSEIGIGNFSYYLAKFAGFNYISKEFDIADGESWFNNDWSEPYCDGKRKDELGRKATKAEAAIYVQKEKMREAFLEDLKSVCSAEGTWVICLLSCVKNSQNATDIHVSHQTKNGKDSAIDGGQLGLFNEIITELSTLLSSAQDPDLNLKLGETDRYPLINNRNGNRNLLFKLREDGCLCNGFSMRISTKLMERNVNKRIVQFILANTIHNAIEPLKRLTDEEIKDMNRPKIQLGFADQEIESKGFKNSKKFLKELLSED